MPLRNHSVVTDRHRMGGARTGVLLWLLGIPIPIIIIVLLVQSCT